MAITKVWLDESSDECVSCGACEATCDAVFSVPEKMQVKEGVDFSAYESEIKDAADSCPAGVITPEPPIPFIIFVPHTCVELILP